MLEHGGSKILPVIPQLIIPIKSKFTVILFFLTGFRRFIESVAFPNENDAK